MPVLCRGRVVRTNVLLGWRPSLHKLRPATGVVVVFVCFIGTSPPSDSSPPFMPDVRLSPSPAGLPCTSAANNEVSRFSCMQFLSVPGVSDYAGPPADSRLRRRVCCLPHLSRRSASRIGFSKLDTLPTDTSVYASTRASRRAPQDSRPGGSLLLSCRTLSFPTTCRFIPAHGQPGVNP